MLFQSRNKHLHPDLVDFASALFKVCLVANLHMICYSFYPMQTALKYSKRISIADVRPSPRRAHVGVIYYVDGIPTLTVHGGRAKDGQLLSDVWSTSLANATHLAWSLRREPENASSTTADDALSNSETFSTDVTENASLTKHHHHDKRSEKNYPEARKGHLAVAIQDSPHHPLMVSDPSPSSSDL